MPELNKGHTFVPGEIVDPDDLNDLVDAATALKGLIHGQTAIATGIDPVNDEVLVWDASVDDLRRAKAQALPSGATSVGVAATPVGVFQVTGSPVTSSGVINVIMRQQTGNKVLAAPADGSLGDVAFRVLSPADLPVATVSIAAAAIDWSLGSMFTKTLTGNITFTFTNATAGQTIRVRVVQDGTPPPRTVTWPVVRWPGGINPVMSTGVGRIDIYTFHFIGGLYYGTFDQDFLL